MDTMVYVHVEISKRMKLNYGLSQKHSYCHDMFRFHNKLKFFMNLSSGRITELRFQVPERCGPTVSYKEFFSQQYRISEFKKIKMAIRFSYNNRLNGVFNCMISIKKNVFYPILKVVFRQNGNTRFTLFQILINILNIHIVAAPGMG